VVAREACKTPAAAAKRLVVASVSRDPVLIVATRECNLGQQLCQD
jgi:hypothetical protein